MVVLYVFLLTYPIGIESEIGLYIHLVTVSYFLKVKSIGMELIFHYIHAHEYNPLGIRHVISVKRL